ncbi:ThiF family adenylyltransferase [Cupriavidus basilensis]|uniref:ThiF family adenylyltransferase n=1 Tax=Cupriavidus basilensis TaxID=68895 RepID=UPI0020A65139|nr:ThiF family adenylyltransferase [Cupriavidus basilensis]MCP3022770.1 ThiF family adenylyltransferase [Cupriavidus basilensis]
MPEVLLAAEAERASASLDEDVAREWPEATALSPAWLNARFRGREFVQGWTLPTTLTGLAESLIFAIDQQYPYSLPRFGLLRKPTLCEMPHVESDGIFCLVAAHVAPAVPVSFGHVCALLGKAIALYGAGTSGVNRTDFLDEFMTYWTLGERKLVDVEAWLTKEGQTTSIWFQQSKSTLYVANSKENVERLLQRREIAIDKQRLTEGLYVHLPFPMYPDSYPRNSYQLLELLRRVAPEFLTTVPKAWERSRKLLVILAFEWSGATMHGACVVEIKSSFPHPRGQGQQLISAFKRKRVSATQLFHRIRDASFPVHRAGLVQIDSDFLLTRTTGKRPPVLGGATVAVFGCGAIGAAVALQLAQAGVRRLVLLDGDVLTMQNIGRHQLGTKYVGANKALAVGREIQSRFVDMDVEAIPLDWDRAKLDDKFWDTTDIIVSATGDWLTDVKLNELTRNGVAPPIVFTWVERFALAGHAILVVPDGGCLRCRTNAVGDYLGQVSRVGGDLPREPGCGAFYQPYSAADASVTVAMTTGLTLEALTGAHEVSVQKTWVGSRTGFVTTGAGIMPEWHERLSEQQGFERTYSAALDKMTLCTQCF